MKGKTRGRRHQNYIIKPFSGLHLSCGDLYERKDQTNHAKRVDKKWQKKKKPKRQKKKKINSKANSLPVAEEYVPHKHSVRHFATQPVNHNTRYVASPPKYPNSLISTNGVTTAHESPLHDVHSSNSNEVTQPSDRKEQHDSPDGAQTMTANTHAGGNSEQLSSLPDSVADLLQVYQRTCELAEIKMASIAPLLDTSRSMRSTMVEHKMVMASPSEHKDYSDAAEVLIFFASERLICVYLHIAD